jgi:hypothetical protein
MAKGWFRRKKEKLVYCWYNANSKELSKVVGPYTMTDQEGWLEVGRLGLDSVVNKPDPATFGEGLHHYLAYGKKKWRTGASKVNGIQGRSRDARDPCCHVAGVASGDSIRQGHRRWMRVVTANGSQCGCSKLSAIVQVL